MASEQEKQKRPNEKKKGLKLELLGTDYKTAINFKLIKMKLENICREL